MGSGRSDAAARTSEARLTWEQIDGWDRPRCVDLALWIDCFESPWRTSYRRAKELWDSADGKFVRSRITGRWVAAPR